MTSIIKSIASRKPALDREGFDRAYLSSHPYPENLCPNDYRAAFDKYKKAARRLKKQPVKK